MKRNDILKLKPGMEMFWNGQPCGRLTRVDTTSKNSRKWLLFTDDPEDGWYWCDGELWTAAPPEEESVMVEVGPVTIKVKLRTVGKG